MRNFDPVATTSPACRVGFRLLIFAGFFLLVLGCRWAFIDTHAVDLPVSDQWDALGETIFHRAADGRLVWRDFFAPHNEHRPALTRLLEYGLALGNAQWDARLETTANAVLAAQLFTLLFAAGWSRVRGGWRLAWISLLALVGTLPYGAENALNGFQSQFYFLALGALGYLWLTLTAERFGWKWILGQSCALFSLFTIAAAAANGLAVALVLGAQMARERRVTPLRLTGFVLALAYLGLSLALWSPAPINVQFHASSLGEWARVFSRVLAWPVPALWPFSLLLAAPVLILAWRCWRKGRLPSREAGVVALALWVFLQCASIAYARGHESMWLAGRYLDLLVLALPMQFLALAHLHRPDAGTGAHRHPRYWMLWAAAAWTLVAAAGLTHQSLAMTQGYTRPFGESRARQVDNVRAYLATGSPDILRHAAADAVPYPNVPVLIERLNTPGIRTLLPVSVRPAIAIRPSAGAAPFTAALPPALEPPPVEPVFSSFAGPNDSQNLVWASTLNPPLPTGMLRLWIAGDLSAGRTDLRLTLCSATTSIDISPEFAPGLHWKRINVPQPAGEWWFEAEDTSATGWFAFTAPVALGRWSWIAGKLLWAGPSIAGTGALLLLAAAAQRLAERRSLPPVPE